MRTPRVVQDQTCPCGRPTVLTAEGKLLLCAGTCDASPQFCTCQAIGLVQGDGLTRLLGDLQLPDHVRALQRKESIERGES